MVDPIREQIIGGSFAQDRLWIITKEGFVGAMTDYNWEITGVTPNVGKLDPDLRYSGNAYYWTSELKRRGYKVEHKEDRR
jgi:hypothetical protein